MQPTPDAFTDLAFRPQVAKGTDDKLFYSQLGVSFIITFNRLLRAAARGRGARPMGGVQDASTVSRGLLLTV